MGMLLKVVVGGGEGCARVIGGLVAVGGGVEACCTSEELSCD